MRRRESVAVSWGVQRKGMVSHGGLTSGGDGDESAGWCLLRTSNWTKQQAEFDCQGWTAKHFWPAVLGKKKSKQFQEQEPAEKNK